MKNIKVTNISNSYGLRISSSPKSIKVNNYGSLSFSIRKTPTPKIKSSVSSGVIMARRLADLLDVDVSNVQNNFVLMYNSEEQKYVAYDPDEVLSASVGGGLPQDFMDYLNSNLLLDSTADQILDALEQLNEVVDNLTLGKLSNVKGSVDFATNYFVLRYDEEDGKYEAVDPDDILSSAIDESDLPEDFINYLNNVLLPKKLSEALNQLTNDIQNITLNDLADVNTFGVKDKYLIMYDSEVSTYRVVNPDEVLRAAVLETTQPGLPNEFLDQLDEDLDNRIDFDGGEF
jgi:hypothetical protein